MKETVKFGNQEERQEFTKAFDIVFNKLFGTKKGPILIALFASEKDSVDAFINSYCEKIIAQFMEQKSIAQEYTASIKKVREYANKYSEVRNYLREVSETMVKAGAEIDILQSR